MSQDAKQEQVKVCDEAKRVQEMKECSKRQDDAKNEILQV